MMYFYVNNMESTLLCLVDVEFVNKKKLHQSFSSAKFSITKKNLLKFIHFQ